MNSHKNRLRLSGFWLRQSLKRIFFFLEFVKKVIKKINTSVIESRKFCKRLNSLRFNQAIREEKRKEFRLWLWRSVHVTLPVHWPQNFILRDWSKFILSAPNDKWKDNFLHRCHYTNVWCILWRNLPLKTFWKFGENICEIWISNKIFEIRILRYIWKNNLHVTF